MTKILALPAVLAAAGVAYWAFSFSRTLEPPPEATENFDLISVLAELPDEEFRRPPPNWQLNLPEDHGTHAEARTETWQLSTHLRNEAGDDLGFQVSFLRLGLTSPAAPPQNSNWDVREVLRGHVTFLAAEQTQAFGEERFARGLAGLAGYDSTNQELRIDEWLLKFKDEREETSITLSATVDNTATVKLVMQPEKTAVALEPDGADAPFVGYFFSRLDVQGTVDQGAGEERVSGTAWLDHSWGDLPVPGTGPVAWDRLLFQLEDGTDVSLIRTRRSDGRGVATTNGVVIDPDGETSTLNDNSIQMTATRLWQHETRGTEYPVAWQLVGPGVDLSVDPVLDDQTHDFLAPFWSGIVTLNGYFRDTPVSGVGTLLLTGYEDR